MLEPSETGRLAAGCFQNFMKVMVMVMSEEQRALYIFLLLVGREDEADRFREACRAAGGDAK